MVFDSVCGRRNNIMLNQLVLMENDYMYSRVQIYNCLPVTAVISYSASILPDDIGNFSFQVIRVYFRFIF